MEPLRSVRLRRAGRFVRSLLDVTATIMVIAASVAIIMLAIATWRRAPSVSLQNEQVAASAFPKIPHTLDGAVLLGTRDAKVALVQYSDFECPFCAQFAKETWPAIKKQYIDSGKLLAAFRHLPLAGHSHAKSAAVSADCAGQQGKFWEMHDGLFEQQAKLTADTGRTVASQLKLDMTLFDECTRKPATGSLSRDKDFAANSGIVGTPTFLIGIVQGDNTVKVTSVLVGAQPLARFTSVVDELLERQGARRLSWLGLGQWWKETSDRQRPVSRKE